jgi:hypothetical protein
MAADPARHLRLESDSAIGDHEVRMRGVFVLYMPPTNHEAMVHYEDTIRNKVERSRIHPYLPERLSAELRNTFGNRKIAVWGSRDSEPNRRNFDKMERGDDILIVEGQTIKLLGKVAAKIVSPQLSRELWKNLRGESEAGWDLIYFIANPLEIGIPWPKFTELLGYGSPFQLRGFTRIANDHVEEFYAQHDDLYSSLVRIRDGLPVETTNRKVITEDAVIPAEETPFEESDRPSDHTRMQWMLSCLGRKAGAKVWVPLSDQSRVSRSFEFKDFEPRLSSGLDTQAKYVENIDVVWKEEFRLDAAFEVENSTSIYSGLLRFSDLIAVAPNTIYPLFIVAPRERKGRVVDQARRPTFRQVHLSERVRFLPYEVVEEVDRFFGDASGGLSVELMRQKSESLV